MSRPNYDATFCSKQPLHLINKIQPHGILLVVSKADLVVQQASANAEALLGVPLQNILNLKASLSSLFATASVEEIQQKSQSGFFRIPVALMVQLSTTPASYIATLHEKDECLLIEIEFQNALRESDRSFSTAYAKLQSLMSAITLCTTVEEVASTVAREMKTLGQFDKVMVYTFDEEWNGTVIAEAMEAGMDAYLGLKFPASDIPKTARDLYLKNPYRIIPNRVYEPVDLVPEMNPVTGAPTNLSDCRLRSVISVHLEYLQNMNVMASMSTRIIHNEKLWGLVACHHRTAKYMSYEECSVFELLSNVISAKISSVINSSAANNRMRLNDLFNKITEKISLFGNLVNALSKDRQSLLAMLGADGVAICWDETITTIGVTPEEKEIQSLRNWLNEKDFPKVVSLHSLSSAFDEAKAYTDVASGLLVLSIQPYAGNYILGFRGEVIQKVTWGGNPNDVITFEPNSNVYHPRNSFNIWKETVRGTSIPWTTEELSTAERFRNVVVEHTLESLAKTLEEKVQERTEALASSKKQLEETFNELAQITYVASHDLQEPARKIRLFANTLKDITTSKEGSDYINRILQSSKRMSVLLADLVNYSNVSQPAELHSIDLGMVVNEVLSDFDLVIEEKKIQVTVRALPTIEAVPDQMRQVFYSLISNSIKFARNNVVLNIRIQGDIVSHDEHLPGGSGPLCRVVVEDNGIGFDQAFVGKIFKVFGRLHSNQEYPGTGIGLAIAKKIIERHGGVIYAKGKEGEGATFTIVVPVKQEDEAV